MANILVPFCLNNNNTKKVWINLLQSVIVFIIQILMTFWVTFVVISIYHIVRYTAPGPPMKVPGPVSEVYVWIGQIQLEILINV